MTKEELYNLIYIDNLSYEEIGRRNNMSGNGIKKMAERLGIELPKRRKINSNETFNKGKSFISNICLNCGKQLDSSKKKFCSCQCKSDFSYREWIQGWKQGDESGIAGDYGISRHLKRYLFEKYNSKCAKCGWGEVNPHTGNIPLEIEHIDGNYTNNTEDNLILLCPNCHSLTSTYKGANRGNGRKTRSKYY